MTGKKNQFSVLEIEPPYHTKDIDKRVKNCILKS